MESFKGKMLVRKSVNKSNGKEVLILTGLFYPSEPMTSFSDKDELWAVELLVAQAAKYEGSGNGLPHSPEDFLEGAGMNVNDDFWQPKP